MTHNEKELLLKDLCSRLSYKVRCSFGVNDAIYEVCGINPTCCGASEIQAIHVKSSINGDFSLSSCKPYLFPLSSMTNEQKEFIKNKFCYDWDIDDHPYSLWAYCIEIGDADELIDWFHKNHIDYRGLIPMGLAIDATGKNIY